MVLGGSLVLLAALASAPGPESRVSLPPPPLPWLVDAFIGYEPMVGFEAEEPGDKWYHENALQVRGHRAFLHQSPVVCRNGELLSSESDGGFYSFQGEINQSKSLITLKYVGCEYCIETKRSAKQRAPRTLTFEQVSATEVRVDGIDYSKSPSPHRRVCPAK